MIPAAPIATYRVQLTRNFGFDDAAAIVPYLKSLGISHLYASPVFTAKPGSTHGYDVIDPAVLNPELGGEAAFLRLSDALLRAELGLIIDFVPNHMCVDCAANKWWWDVLENGRAGPHGATFDIDWDAGGGRVILPVLGRPYEECLDAGEIQLGEEGGKPVIRYFDHRFPISPTTRAAQVEGKKQLHELLEGQHYRLAHWRIANRGINYRRFFDINSLAGVRIELPAVFDSMHAGVRRLLADGRLQGIRIDHIDGLADPAKYCADLQRLIQLSAPNASIYVVVEKILGEGEDLPRWAGVAGTTGYEWLNVISRTLADPAGVERMAQHWHTISPPAPSFDDVLRGAKEYALARLFAGEFGTLVRILAGIASDRSRRFAADQLSAALRRFLLAFDVYRTYVTDKASPEDRARIERTIARAEQDGGQDGNEIFPLLQDVLTAPRGPEERRFVTKLQQLTGPLMAKGLEDMALYRDHRLLALNEVGNEPTLPPLAAADFHGRMATRRKDWPDGLTATATHDTKRGEDARMRILSIAELADDWVTHSAAWMQRNAGHLQNSDGRRMPSAHHEYMLYQALLGGWPDEAIDEDFRKRFCAYAVKAAREGKQDTSWLDPNEQYEAALQAFIEKTVHRDNSAFLGPFETFAERCALLGALRSLVQVAVKAMQPGVPDFYQGTEFWDLSFVDPDNRRPVDFASRVAALDELPDTPAWDRLAGTWRDGCIKLALTAKLLRIRAAYRELFSRGDYLPVETDSPDILAFGRSHAGERLIVVVVRNFRRATVGGTRWPQPQDWQGAVELPPAKTCSNLLQQPSKSELGAGSTPVADLLGRLPVAVVKLS
jgi:(1->4)-alpha-D-glucan 1-alpha-D-glucosylmutase